MSGVRPYTLLALWPPSGLSWRPKTILVYAFDSLLYWLPSVIVSMSVINTVFNSDKSDVHMHSHQGDALQSPFRGWWLMGCEPQDPTGTAGPKELLLEQQTLAVTNYSIYQHPHCHNGSTPWQYFLSWMQIIQFDCWPWLPRHVTILTVP